MSIETEKALYRQASTWRSTSIPYEIEELCRREFPILTVPISDDLRVLRVMNLGMAIPYLGGIIRFLNDNLPIAYPRFTIEQLTEELHTLPDGRVVDFKETWRGNTFLIEEGENLVGVAIGRREVIVNHVGSGVFTGRGYVPIVAASSEIWGTPKVALLSLPIKSLAESGVAEIRGSCAPSNTLAEKLFSRFAIERQQEGEWIRYKFDPEIGNQFFEFIVRKFNISEESARILLMPTRSESPI
jgi:hypothetical protein